VVLRPPVVPLELVPLELVSELVPPGLVALPDEPEFRPFSVALLPVPPDVALLDIVLEPAPVPDVSPVLLPPPWFGPQPTSANAAQTMRIDFFIADSLSVFIPGAVIN